MAETILPTDDDARSLARDLIGEARFGALGVTSPKTGASRVSRIALAAMDGALVTLVSDLAHHTAALRLEPRCGVLIARSGLKGDPMTHPRLSLSLTAAELPDKGLRDRWLAAHPKAKLYVDFGDFRFFRLTIDGAELNGGFGRAYELAPADLSE